MGAGASTNAGNYVFAEFGGAAGSRAAEAAAAAGGGGAAAAAAAPAEGVRGFISPFPGSPEEPATYDQIRKWKEELPNKSNVPTALHKTLQEIKSKLEEIMTQEIRSGQDRINKKYYTSVIKRLASQYEDALEVHRLDELRGPGTPNPAQKVAPREVAPQTLDQVKLQVQVALKRAQQVSATGVARQDSSKATLNLLLEHLLEFPKDAETSILMAEIERAIAALREGDIYEPSDKVKEILPELVTLSTLRF